MNHDMVGDLDYVLVYLDDILVLSNQDDSFEDHLAKIQEVFKRLHNVGLKVNLHKTELYRHSSLVIAFLLLTPKLSHNFQSEQLCDYRNNQL